MKTLAAILEKTNSPLPVEELTVPELKPGQVLVKIDYSGICHTQLNEIGGLKGEDKFLPHTLGHEGAGIVLEAGPEVKKVQPGDHVVLTWIKGKGMDVPATQYRRQNGMVVNSGAISTFMTKAVISENRLVKITEKMPLREAALLGCAIPTGVGIITNTLKVPAGSSVGIFGMGGIGLSALLGAKVNGTAIIVAVDINNDKLDNAVKLGATHTVNVHKEDAQKKIMEITGDKGLDYAIECAGKKESMERAFKSVRDKGGICVIAGNLPQGEQISIDPFDLIKGKRIIGTWGGETQPDRDIPLFVDWYLQGKLDLNKLAIQCHKLAEINEAISNVSRGKAGRVIVDMSGE